MTSSRRKFLQYSLAGASLLALGGCGGDSAAEEAKYAEKGQ